MDADELDDIDDDEVDDADADELCPICGYQNRSGNDVCDPCHVGLDEIEERAARRALRKDSLVVYWYELYDYGGCSGTTSSKRDWRTKTATPQPRRSDHPPGYDVNVDPVER